VLQEKKVIIELDGSQHLDQQEYDDERTKYLEALGYRVLRFWNHEVMDNTETVLTKYGVY
jgi:very-short-patch-repair endonuclease